MYITTAMHASGEFSETRYATFEISENDLVAIRKAQDLFEDSEKMFIKMTRYATCAEIWKYDYKQDPGEDVEDRLFDSFYASEELPEIPALVRDTLARFDFAYMNIWRPIAQGITIGFTAFFKHDSASWDTYGELSYEDLVNKCSNSWKLEALA